MKEVAKILKPGFLTTIQDLGRYGFQKDGIVVAGAMDTYSYQLANLLVGNLRHDAALEITLIGPTIEFLAETQIAITGRDAIVLLDDEKIPLWKTKRVKKGQVLKILSTSRGARLYLAIAGGLIVPKILNSYSTYLAGKIGGYDGRKLEKGDILFGKEKLATSRFERFLSKHLIPSWEDKATIRVIRGPEFSLFTSDSQEHFFQSIYEVTTSSDRMGYRLIGEQLHRNVHENMISEAITIGTIQVPEDGQPIILMADRQTTGGYFRIANVISVDLPKLAQLQAQHKIRFQEVTIEEAQKLYTDREKLFRSIEIGARIL